MAASAAGYKPDLVGGSCYMMPDKSLVTGESVLVARGPGEMVVVALANAATLLRVRMATAASDNAISRIAQRCESYGFPCPRRS